MKTNAIEVGRTYYIEEQELDRKTGELLSRWKRATVIAISPAFVYVQIGWKKKVEQIRATDLHETQGGRS